MCSAISDPTVEQVEDATPLSFSILSLDSERSKRGFDPLMITPGVADLVGLFLGEPTGLSSSSTSQIVNFVQFWLLTFPLDVVDAALTVDLVVAVLVVEWASDPARLSDRLIDDPVDAAEWTPAVLLVSRSKSSISSRWVSIELPRFRLLLDVLLWAFMFVLLFVAFATPRFLLRVFSCRSRKSARIRSSSGLQAGFCEPPPANIDWIAAILVCLWLPVLEDLLM